MRRVLVIGPRSAVQVDGGAFGAFENGELPVSAEKAAEARNAQRALIIPSICSVLI
jgi:hypothetical protein